MKTLKLILITLFFALPVFAQSSISKLLKPDVIVVDEQGKAIRAAKVEPVSLSINYPKVETDKQGKSSWGFKLQKVEWVTVSKKGYHTVVQAKIRGLPKPVKITLKKIVVKE